MRIYHDWDEEGECGGRDVYLSDVESPVLGPDGEPLRKSRRGKVGFDLRASKKSKSVIKNSIQRNRSALKRLADR